MRPNANYSCISDKIAIQYQDAEMVGQLYDEEIQITDINEQ